MVARLVIVMLCVVTNATWAAAPSAPTLYDVEALAAWARLEESEVVPYHAEGLSSELLYGARSPKGSYVFITRIDNTINRPALTTAELEGMFRAETYSDLQPLAFSTAIDGADAPGGTQLYSVVCSFRTKRLGYKVGAGADGALVKTVFLPIVMKNLSSGIYSNLIYVANFRGDPGDLQDLADFDRMRSRIAVPDGFSLVESQRFNVLQPGLAAQGTGVASPPRKEARDGIGAATRDPSEAEEDPRALAEALLDRLAGRETPAGQRRLDRISASYRGTVLSDVISALAAEQALDLQRSIWREVLKSPESAAKARFVAHFLARSIDLRDWQAAEALALDASAASLSLATLSPDDLNLVLDSVLRLWEAPPESPELHTFFSLREGEVSDTLRSLLSKRGFPSPQIEEIAERDRKGSLRPKAPLTPGGLPRLASDAGRIVILRLENAGREPLLRLTELSNLFQLSSLRRPGGEHP